MRDPLICGFPCRVCRQKSSLKLQSHDSLWWNVLFLLIHHDLRFSFWFLNLNQLRTLPASRHFLKVVTSLSFTWRASIKLTNYRAWKASVQHINESVNCSSFDPPSCIINEPIIQNKYALRCLMNDRINHARTACHIKQSVREINELSLQSKLVRPQERFLWAAVAFPELTSSIRCTSIGPRSIW